PAPGPRGRTPRRGRRARRGRLPGGDRAARRRRGHRSRPGRGDLRRHPRRRLRHHLRHRPQRGAAVTVLATAIGSMPGGDPLASEEDNARAFTEAVRIVRGELPDLPHLPELPGRSPGATLTGRGVALLEGLAADLQPAGWRLTDSSGVDHRRARSLLGRDLDTFEELLLGWEG